MSRLPIIAGFGGVNAAGRSSQHNAYRRMVFDALNEQKQQDVLSALRQMMVGSDELSDYKVSQQRLLDGTLIRKIGSELFDTEKVSFREPIKLGEAGSPVTFTLKAKSMPQDIPESWKVTPVGKSEFSIEVDALDCHVETLRALKVQSGGQLPSGFNPGSGYNSRNHPRGLQMTIYGISDALGSLGVAWEDLRKKLAPDQLSVYAGSAMSQLDPEGNGGMLAARYQGKRTSSKQCPFGFAEMPADFVNAYVLGGMGTTGTNMGACASFLYNLRQGIQDIQSGRSRMAVVGSAEAPITPDIINGYAAMSALATDAELAALDGGKLNHRRACRPFGENCGFTLGESAQFIILLDDELALEVGAKIYGAVTDVFINADGYKKSISAPGAGNYLTVAKALASGRSLLGEQAIQHGSFVQAHGTGTPQNRVTESHVLNTVAKHFGIEAWPVVAVKAFVGHSIGAAGADQLVATLGIWEEGILPGINTIDAPAEDVHRENLSISNRHREVDSRGLDFAVINAKGFGGNNASAAVVSPKVAQNIAKNKAGAAAWRDYEARLAATNAAIEHYEERVIQGDFEPHYYFDHNVLSADDIAMSEASLQTPLFGDGVDLNMASPYKQWL